MTQLHSNRCPSFVVQIRDQFARAYAMLKWGFVFLLLAVASGLFGVAVSDTASFALAQLLFFGNVVLFVVFTLLGALMPRSLDGPHLDPTRQRDR
ncbi:MAG: DUF1328 domain-containing protein [Casimicrobiaceae bacterium]